MRGLALAGDLRAADNAAEFYSTFGMDASRLADIQGAGGAINNELSRIGGWASLWGLSSTALGWGSFVDSRFCNG